MSKIILAFCLCLQLTWAHAQDESIGGGIKLFIDPNTNSFNSEFYTASLQQRLNSKMTMLINKTGIVESGYSNFFVYPRIDVIGTTVNESGMSKIYMTECELFITIERQAFTTNNGADASGGAVLQSISKKLVGSSLNSKESLSAAINALSTDDPKLIAFFSEARTKIQKYYQEHCEEVLAEAKKMSNLGKLAHSVALYFSIPSTAPPACYKKAVEGSQEVYVRFLNETCKSKLISLKANVALALQSDSLGSVRYNEALLVLKSIPPSSGSCYGEALAVIEKIENRLSDQQKQEWAFLKELSHDENEVKKEAMKAIGKMSKSYTPAASNNVIIQNRN